MSFTLTPAAPPVAERANNEFDQLIPQVAELQSAGQWASTIVPTADVESFKRKYREAANRAGHSAKFAKDTTDDAGNVTLTFTLQDKIVRAKRDETATDEPTAEEPTAKPGK